MAALAVKVCLRKKGKVSRPSKLKIILLGYYIEFGLRDQEACVNFGMSGCNAVNR